MWSGFGYKYLKWIYKNHPDYWAKKEKEFLLIDNRNGNEYLFPESIVKGIYPKNTSAVGGIVLRVIVENSSITYTGRMIRDAETVRYIYSCHTAPRHMLRDYFIQDMEDKEKKDKAEKVLKVATEKAMFYGKIIEKSKYANDFKKEVTKTLRSKYQMPYILSSISPIKPTKKQIKYYVMALELDPFIKKINKSYSNQNKLSDYFSAIAMASSVQGN